MRFPIIWNRLVVMAAHLSRPSTPLFRGKDVDGRHKRPAMTQTGGSMSPETALEWLASNNSSRVNIGTLMFYWLSSFSDVIGPLNVLRYITTRTGGSMFTA